MLGFPEIKLGKVIIFNNQPHVVIRCDFLKMNRQKPSKKTTLRNLITGNNLIYNFKSGETVEEADIRKELAVFTYQDQDSLYFMLDSNFETVEIPVEMMSGKADYLKDGLGVTIQYFDDKPISVELPIKVTYEVISTTDVDKGNTVQGVLKDATIETGKIIKVPAFIKTGEKIIVNTVEDEYSEREKES